MLNAKKMRKACLVTVSIVALLVAMVLGLASCSTPVVTGAEYQAGSIAKSTYEVGEVLDITGAKLVVTYSDGSTKTVDVTHEMVGTVPLTVGGTQKVYITYTEGDVTVYPVLEVTVVDPNVALNAAKDAAVDEINALVSADDKADSVIAALLSAFEAKIGAANDEAAIDAAVADFAEAVNSYKAGLSDSATALADAKTAGVALMDAAMKKFADKGWNTKYPNLYAEALNKYNVYAASVNAAETAAAATAYANACVAEIDAVYDKIKDYDDQDEQNAVNELKIDLINEIRSGEDKIVNSPWYSDDVKVSVAVKVQNTIERIYLALDIGYCNDLAEEILAELGTTKGYLDMIYDAYLLVGDVRYTDESEYKIENVWVLYYDCLDNISEELGAGAEDELIAALKEYTPIGSDEAIDLWEGPVENDEYSSKYEGVVGKTNRYLELAKAVSVAVNGVEKTDISDPGVDVIVNGVKIESVIDMIDEIGDVTVDSLPAIQAAYDNYLLWAKYYNIITDVAEVDPAELTADSALYVASNGEPVVIYIGVDGNDKATIVENYAKLFEKWTEYVTITEALAEELDALKAVIDSIGTVLIGIDGEVRLDGTTPVDSLALIVDAEAKYAAITNNRDYNSGAHADAYFIEDGVDYRTVLTAARTTYDDLMAKAKDLNREIGRLMNNLEYVEVADKATLDGIASAFDTFCAANTETVDGESACYYGVIAEYAYYLKALDAWQVKNYRDELKVNAVKGINLLLADYKTMGLDDEVIAEIEGICEDYIGQIEDRDYVALADDAVVSQEALEDNFAENSAAIKEIYDAAKAAMEEAAN